MKKLIPFITLVALIVSNSTCAISKQTQIRAETRASAQVEQAETQVRQVLMDLIAAVNSANAEKAASLWSAESIFIDQLGEQWRGRPTIQARFDQVLKKHLSSEVDLHPQSLKFLAPNVAVVVGDVSRKSGTARLPVTRFSFVLTKINDVWLIDEATETAIQEVDATDHLKELEWLIGTWKVDKPENQNVTLEVEWDANRKFLLSKCSKLSNANQVDRQVIGWDPRTRAIVSWHFDCNGGFGYGKWTRQDKTWTIDFAGVSANGWSNRTTNIFKVIGPEAISWQSISQDTENAAINKVEATLKRVDKMKM